MPTVHVPAHLTVEHMMAAVKQLSSAELHEFREQFEAWLQQHGKQTTEEAVLLACIEDNSGLPVPEQRRFQRLRSKHHTETLTKAEAAELQAFWQRVEQMNVARLEALTVLAQLRGTEVKKLMRELGLGKSPDVF